MLRQRRPRQKDEKHLSFIRRLPCVLCGGHSEAAHIRYGDPRHDKRPTGAGERPSDCYVLPLCPAHHRLTNEAQHESGERAWWAGHGIDPIPLALALHGASGDVEAGEAIIRRAR